jgi:Tfp pilus assembly protein PilO
MASMSARDRKILFAIVPVVVLVAYYFLLLAPARQEASTAKAAKAKQEQRLEAAKASMALAASAKTDFRSDYTQIVRLGKAIPARVDMPSLLVQLEGAAKGTGIRFTKISTGERTPVAPAATAGSTPPADGSTPPAEGTTPPAEGTTPPATPTAAGGQPAQSPPGQAAEGANDAAAQSGVDPTTSTTASPGGLPVGGGSTTDPATGAPVPASGALETVPLEMEFVGDFFKLADFFHDIKRFVHVVNDDVVVNGRLVTIESVSYASDPVLFPRLRATIKATVYLAPQTQGTTAGATPQGPSATTPPATTPAATPAPATTPSPAPTAAATP